MSTLLRPPASPASGAVPPLRSGRARAGRAPPPHCRRPAFPARAPGARPSRRRPSSPVRMGHPARQRLLWSERQRAILACGSPEAAALLQVIVKLLPCEEDRDSVIALVRDLLIQAEPGVSGIEHRVVRPSGEVRWVFANGACSTRAPKARRRGSSAPCRRCAGRASAPRRTASSCSTSSTTGSRTPVRGDKQPGGARRPLCRDRPGNRHCASRPAGEALAQAHDLLQPGIVGPRARRPADRPRAAQPGDPGAVRRRPRTRSPVEGPKMTLRPRPRQPGAWCSANAPPNAVESGALGAAGGTVTLSSTRPPARSSSPGRERGGPPVAAPPAIAASARSCAHEDHRQAGSAATSGTWDAGRA